MPPACTPEKRFDNQRNGSEDTVSPLLTFQTPPRNANNRTTKYLNREERHIEWLSQKLPSIKNVFKLHKQIGEGTFSAVFVASLVNDSGRKRLFAIKHLVPTTHPKRIEVELCCLKQIGGKDNVVGLDLCLRENDNIVFVMPYLKHQQFTDYVYDMDSNETVLYIKNLLQAVHRVHSFRIIHRDIKPNNFLYDRVNKKFLLVDFGLAQVCPTSTPPQNIKTELLKRKRDDDENSNESVIIKNKDYHEPPTKRLALQRKNINNLNCTVSHLQNCLVQDLTLSKENIPKNMQTTEIKSTFLSPKKSNRKTPKKSPHKFSGLSTTHLKMSLKSREQRNLFKNSDESNDPKFPTVSLDTNRVATNLRGAFPAPRPVIPKVDHPILRDECRCYGKANICTICLLRKAQEAPRAGTPGFRPPEVLLKYSNQTTSVDMWAVGVTMLCILSGCYPFFRAPDDITALAEMITLFGHEKMTKLAKMFGQHLTCSEKKPALDLRKVCCNLRARGSASTNQSQISCKLCTQLLSNCLCVGTPLKGVKDIFPKSAYDLLARLLDVNPYTRITAEHALKHPFLN